MEDTEDDIQIEEVCNFLKSIIKALSESRKIAILNVLINDGNCTFEEIQTKTKISTGSLHGHLMELLRLKFVYRTNDRPMRYVNAKLLYKLVFIREEF